MTPKGPAQSRIRDSFTRWGTDQLSFCPLDFYTGVVPFSMRNEHFVHKCRSPGRPRLWMSVGTPEIDLGLSTGTRLRARLESATSTAVRAPVLAVVEYTYERDGQILVPAGAKAVGRIQEADRSGYMRIQFESLLMPDGATVPIQGVATDLDMRPLKGKIEEKNTGKNILVRSLSRIGQAGALLLGHGSLNQPLRESLSNR